MCRLEILSRKNRTEKCQNLTKKDTNNGFIFQGRATLPSQMFYITPPNCSFRERAAAAHSKLVNTIKILSNDPTCQEKTYYSLRN